MSFAVQDRPLDVPFSPPQLGGGQPDFSNPVAESAWRAGDIIRSQYYQNPTQFENAMPSLQNTFGSMFGFFPGGNMLQQLYQMLQQFFSGQGGGEQYFQNASGGSVGDPHLSFNGNSWDNMGSQPDLLHSDSIPGGYQISTKTTPPAANGVTYNQSATITTNNGATSVTMDKDGDVTVSQYGNGFSLQSGQSADLGNGEFVQRNADGSLVVTCNNGTGGNITTTMRSNGPGIDVNTNANNVDLGGALVNGGSPTTPEPVKMPMQRQKYTNYDGVDFN